MSPNLRRRRSSSAATPEHNIPPPPLDRPPPDSPIATHENSPDPLQTPTAEAPATVNEGLSPGLVTTDPPTSIPIPIITAIPGGSALDETETHAPSSPGNTAPRSGSGLQSASEPPSRPSGASDSQPPSSEGSGPNGSRVFGDNSLDRSALDLLDQLLDTVTGARPPESSNTQESATNPDTAANTDPAASIPGANVNIINDTGDAAGASGASISTTGATPDNSGAIVITVNYMFLDTGNDPSPGRTGSLVVTLPNNATNREPRIISQFISLATRMAYSTLLNGPKPKPGITVEKFQSFKTLDVSQLQDTTCPVCFDQYDPLVVEPILGSKRRKLTPDSHSVSGNATPERSSEPIQTNTETAQASTDASDENGGTQQQPEKPYLCDDNTEFTHIPIQLPCGHVFGQGCLAQWLKEHTTCPLCRVSVADPEEQQSAQRVAPISYIRFGGLGDALNNGGQEPSPSTSEGESPQGATTPITHDTNIPGLLRRATQAIFNNTHRAREAPAPPFEADGYREPTQSRNPSFVPVINNIQNYFRRSRRQREQDTTGATSLFTTGVSSRRTDSGVETYNTDSPSASSFFEQLRYMSEDLRERMSSNEDNRNDTADQNERNGEEDEGNP